MHAWVNESVSKRLKVHTNDFEVRHTVIENRNVTLVKMNQNESRSFYETLKI